MSFVFFYIGEIFLFNIQNYIIIFYITFFLSKKIKRRCKTAFMRITTISLPAIQVVYTYIIQSFSYNQFVLFLLILLTIEASFLSYRNHFSVSNYHHVPYSNLHTISFHQHGPDTLYTHY